MSKVIEVISNVTTVPSRTSRLISAMQEVIKSHGLELMQRYPNDLLVHDRYTLEGLEGATCSIAWCVGHCHTHMVVLGMHPEENSMIECFQNLSSDDKFYKIILQGSEDFKLVELTKENFSVLKSIRVAYEKKGGKLEFVILKDGKPMFNVFIKQQGTFETRKFNISYQPLTSVTAFDKRAAEQWAYKSIASYIGTLFYTLGETVWHPQRRDVTGNY